MSHPVAVPKPLTQPKWTPYPNMTPAQCRRFADAALRLAKEICVPQKRIVH